MILVATLMVSGVFMGCEQPTSGGVDLNKYPHYIDYSGDSTWSKGDIAGYDWVLENSTLYLDNQVAGTCTEKFHMYDGWLRYGISSIEPNDYGASKGLEQDDYNLYSGVDYKIDFNGNNIYVWLAPNTFNMTIVRATSFTGTSFKIGSGTYTRNIRVD